MRTIKIGTKNDATVYAVLTAKGLVPVTTKDLEFVTPDYEIQCDSGVYPGTDFEQSVCDEAQSFI